jgi:hypothetical protein
MKLSEEVTEHKRWILSRGVDDLAVTANPPWGGFNVHLLLYQDTAWSLSRLEPKNLSKPRSL